MGTGRRNRNKCLLSTARFIDRENLYKKHKYYAIIRNEHLAVESKRSFVLLPPVSCSCALLTFRHSISTSPTFGFRYNVHSLSPSLFPCLISTPTLPLLAPHCSVAPFPHIIVYDRCVYDRWCVQVSEMSLGYCVPVYLLFLLTLVSFFWPISGISAVVHFM